MELLLIMVYCGELGRDVFYLLNCPVGLA